MHEFSVTVGLLSRWSVFPTQPQIARMDAGITGCEFMAVLYRRSDKMMVIAPYGLAIYDSMNFKLFIRL